MNKFDETPNHSIPSPPRIEQFEILGVLGHGANSTVYRAMQIQLQRQVALKVLSHSAQLNTTTLERFRKEAKITSELVHPNIVKLMSYGMSEDQQPYLVLELLEGYPLSTEIERNAPLSFGRFKEIFLPILSALEYAHEKGLVHRDIKPSNIMICKTDENQGTVKLLDFGIAKAEPLGATLNEQISTDGSSSNKQERKEPTQGFTKTGCLLGSPQYMSPEQCKGLIADARSDLYSISCIMYEALSAELPFKAETSLELMQKHVSESLPDARELSKQLKIPYKLSSLLLSGLAKEAGQRPQSAKEFSSSLEKILEDVTLDRAPRKQVDTRNNTKFQVTILLAAVSFLIAVPTYLYFTKTSKSIKTNVDKFKKTVSGKSASSLVHEARRAEYNDDLIAAKEKWVEASKAYLNQQRESDKDRREYATCLNSICRCIKHIIESPNSANKKKLAAEGLEYAKSGLEVSRNAPKKNGYADFVAYSLSFLRCLNPAELENFCKVELPDIEKLPFYSRANVLSNCAEELRSAGRVDLARGFGQGVLQLQKYKESAQIPDSVLYKAEAIIVAYKFKHESPEAASKLALKLAKKIEYDSYLGSPHRLSTFHLMRLSITNRDLQEFERTYSADFNKNFITYFGDPYATLLAGRDLAFLQVSLGKKKEAVGTLKKCIDAVAVTSPSSNNQLYALLRNLEIAISLAKQEHDPRLSVLEQTMKQVQKLKEITEPESHRIRREVEESFLPLKTP